MFVSSTYVNILLTTMKLLTFRYEKNARVEPSLGVSYVLHLHSFMYNLYDRYIPYFFLL